MKIFEGSASFSEYPENIVLTIGNFDGVHLGHQETIKRTIDHASELNCKSAVMIFDPHPRTFFNKNKPQRLITTLEQRLELFKELGIDIAIVETFNDDFSNLSASEFVKTVLVNRLKVQHLIVSSKFRFGSQATGTVTTLLNESEKYGFEVTTIDNIYFRHTVISSSFIRNAILDGEMEIVRFMMGRPYTLKGVVYSDTQRGTNLFNTPTSNIKPENDLVPALGIYASVFEMNDIRYPAATYIGTRPTFEGKDLVIETHIIGFDGDLYGKHMTVELFRKTRGDEKFTHLSDLLHQIKADIKDCVEYLNRHKNDPQVGELQWPE
jgi:riboflavin kinase/FMN adenylyltransferase